jgi:signal transduction histidine kinase/CheY-like chemotaxis protein
MKSLQKKILIIYVIASTCLIGLGIFSWYSSNQLTIEIKELSKPNIKSRLYNQITTDLSKLNNAYLTYTASESFDTVSNHQVLLNRIKINIELLKSEYDPWDSISINSLTRIPFLLDTIEAEYFELQKKKKENQKQFIEQLERELKKDLKQHYNIDPVYIIKNITKEILLTQQFDSIYFKSRDQKEKKNFFFNLFKKKQEDSLLVTANIRKDTIQAVSMDTIQTNYPHPDINASIERIFAKLYDQELKRLNQLHSFEKAIYAKNSMITYKIEGMINEFRLREAKTREIKNQELYQHSKKFSRIIVGVILFFVTISLLFLYLITRDIQKNQYYQKQLLRNEEKALREATEKQKFLATMSHELRTPLTSIIGYAELLEDDKEHTKAIKSSSKYLLHVVNEVLDMAKIVAGKIEINPEPVNFTNILREIKRNFELMNNKSALKTIFEIPNEDWVVKTDEIRINQIIYNLLHNAIKFTHKGFIRLSATINSVNEKSVKIRVEIEDSGIGIKPTDQERIFEDYHQAGTHKYNNKGSGLGLGIVKELVTRLNGTISLKSQQGEGTCFTIEFTMEKDTLPEQSVQELKFSQNVFDGLKFFSVDDDPLISRLYKNILQAHGAEVNICDDPWEALEHLKIHSYDLVITDIKMPGLSGHHLLKTLEKENKRPQKIIASTANVLMSEQDKELLKLFDDIIIKPVTRKNFLEKIAAALGIEPEYELPEIENITPEFTNIIYEYNLDEIRAYSMDDETLFKELVEEMVIENQKELENCHKCLINNDFIGLGGIIHKLSSRFGQIKVKPTCDVKELENNLLKNHMPDKSKVNELLNTWSAVNELLKKDCLQKA